jgi:hypothetical protein
MVYARYELVFYTKQQKYIYIVDSDINLHIIDIFQPKGIRVLGQRKNFTQYKLLCALILPIALWPWSRLRL